MKKYNIKTFACILCLTMLLNIFLPYNIYAQNPTSSDYTYTVNNNEVTITGYTGSVGYQQAITIPESIEGYPVTEIGKAAFSFKNFASVTIPSTVTKVGERAFYYCSNLAIINMTESINEVGVEAFDQTLWMNNYPNDHVIIGSNILIKYKGRTDFYGPSDITIPSGVITINEAAFKENNRIENVVIPDSVKIIGENSFFSCNGLKSVTIGNGVVDIGDNAFYACNDLNEVVIGNSVERIGQMAFSGAALEAVTIPTSVTSLYINSFSNCSKLKEINVNEGNSVYCSQDGVLFTADMKKLLFYPVGKSGSYKVPDGVTEIGEKAFARNVNITEIMLPNTLEIIGSHAFENCTYITDMQIPNSVTSIEEYAFSDCDRLYNITLSDNLKYISNGMLKNTGIANFVISDNIQGIGESAFENCRLLQTVSIGNNVEAIGDKAFWLCNKLTQVSMGYKVKSIGSYAFDGCSVLESITIPDSVASIGECAFRGVPFKTVTIGKGVQSIGFAAFNCPDLMYVAFTGDAPQIAEKAFVNNDINFTILYKIGSSGFTNPWNGYRTVQTDDLNIELPGIVKNRTLKMLSNARVKISWGALNGADGYDVFCKKVLVMIMN